jgi:tetratricopeptide (TPR) repeat protein
MDDAIAHYERALAINPDHFEAHSNLGIILKNQGKFDDAMAHYERAIALGPDYAEAHFSRAEIKTFHPGDTELKSLEALADRLDLPVGKRTYINFAVAKALEDSGDYARAFEYMRTGNALKRRQIHYDETNVLRLFELLLAGSGCAALIYEIVWLQLLQLVIGSSAISLGLLLAAYMGESFDHFFPLFEDLSCSCPP